MGNSDKAPSIAHGLAKHLRLKTELFPGLDPAAMAIEMAEANGVRVPSVITDELLGAYRMLDGSVAIVRPSGLEAALPDGLSTALDGYIFETLAHFGHDLDAIFEQSFTVGMAQESAYKNELESHAKRRQARWSHMTVDEARAILRDAGQGLFPQAPAFSEAFECSLEQARDQLIYLASTRIEIHEAVYGRNRPRRPGPKP